jgi:large subunit ribosomal protein L18
MDKFSLKKKRYQRRRLRVKKAILQRNTDVMRLCISKSNKSLYAQIIDDEKGSTVVALSTLAKDFAAEKNKSNIKAATSLGKAIAEKAKAAGITKVKFDRNGFLYHGKIKAFADSARENGLDF